MSSTQPPIIVDNYSFDWVNGTFILSLVTLLGGGGAYCLRYFLKSRCTRIKCGCIECVRDPIPADQINEVTINARPHPPV
jgi:hypothetical protein